MSSTRQTAVSADGTRLAITCSGPADAPAVLLSHSLGADHRLWDALARELEGTYRVVRYDSRGHGASDVPVGSYSIEDLGADALAVMDAMEIRRAHFVGLSMGAITGMWLAAHRGHRINRLVAASTTAYIPVKPRWDELAAQARAGDMARIGADMMGGWLSPAFKAAQPERAQALIDGMANMSPEGFAASCAVLRDVDLREDLTRITAPTLVVAGIDDGERGAASAAFLSSTIPGAQRLDLADSAHMNPAESPEAFNHAVAEFLA